MIYQGVTSAFSDKTLCPGYGMLVETFSDRNRNLAFFFCCCCSRSNVSERYILHLSNEPIALISEFHFPLTKERTSSDHSSCVCYVFCFILSRSFELWSFTNMHCHYSTGQFLIHRARCWLRFSQLFVGDERINTIHGGERYLWDILGKL